MDILWQNDGSKGGSQVAMCKERQGPRRMNGDHKSHVKPEDNSK